MYEIAIRKMGRNACPQAYHFWQQFIAVRSISTGNFQEIWIQRFIKNFHIIPLHVKVKEMEAKLRAGKWFGYIKQSSQLQNFLTIIKQGYGHLFTELKKKVSLPSQSMALHSLWSNILLFVWRTKKSIINNNFIVRKGALDRNLKHTKSISSSAGVGKKKVEKQSWFATFSKSTSLIGDTRNN